MQYLCKDNVLFVQLKNFQMKKILVLINDYMVPATALNFAIKFAVQNEATLFGIFVQSLKYSDDSYLFPSDIILTDQDSTIATDEDEHLQFLDTSIKSFAGTCVTANVSFKTHTCCQQQPFRYTDRLQCFCRPYCMRCRYTTYPLFNEHIFSRYSLPGINDQ